MMRARNIDESVIDVLDDVRRWRDVIWNGPIPPAASLEARHGSVADELVARWDGFVPVPAVSAFFEAVGPGGIGVLVDWTTGRVVGVHVYPLLHGAVTSYPHWERLALPSPPAAAVAALVADVRALFDRHGVVGDDPTA